MTIIPYQPPRRRNPISLTPLIDVVFILLIFFMLTSAYIDYRAIELPVLGRAGSDAEELPDQNIIRIAVSATDLHVSGAGLDPLTSITRDELAQLLQQQQTASSQLAAVVIPKPQTPMQRTVDVLDILALNGVSSIQFESESP